MHFVRESAAQTFALPYVRTELVMAVDADTTLASEAIEKLLEYSDGPAVAAASGAVLPRHVRSISERERPGLDLSPDVCCGAGLDSFPRASASGPAGYAAGPE